MKDLGEIFDQSLSFDYYISFCCRSTHFLLRNIGRIRHLLCHDATAQLERVRRLPTFNMFKIESKQCYFYVILILNPFTFTSHYYIELICIVLRLLQIIIIVRHFP